MKRSMTAVIIFVVIFALIAYYIAPEKAVFAVGFSALCLVLSALISPGRDLLDALGKLNHLTLFVAIAATILVAFAVQGKFADRLVIAVSVACFFLLSLVSLARLQRRPSADQDSTRTG